MAKRDHLEAVTLLGEYFAQSAKRYPQRPALFAAGRTLSYDELRGAAASIAEALDRGGAGAQVGVVAHRSWAAYAGILGTLLSGRTYVPLNPKFPIERNQTVVALAELDTVIFDVHERAPAFHDAQGRPLKRLAVAWPGDPGSNPGTALPADELLVIDVDRHVSSLAVEPDAVAYLLFTSGTTGTPKGVPITHRNAAAYIDVMRGRAELGPADRCSQTFDLTFDLSVHDMFLTWSVGACLCVLPEAALMAPAKFIREQALTAWFSVPSTIGFMQKLRLLKPGTFPALRYSWFCGEALPAASARAWQEAAPNSVVENLYGPTEATIAFTVYRWRGNERDENLQGGLVPIGTPFGELETTIIDEQGRPLTGSGLGELCLGGVQLSPGYWRDRVKTAAAFIQLECSGKRATRWYRTGDLASATAEGVLQFHGRVDSQVKVLGHRVELGDIEHVLRRVAGTDLVAAVAWPLTDGSAAGIVAFVSGNRHGKSEILKGCEQQLPPYMIPKDVHELDAFPTNANGKIDRGRLRKLLESQST